MFAHELLETLEDQRENPFERPKPKPKEKPIMAELIRQDIKCDPGYPRALYMGTKDSYKKIRVFTEAEEEIARKEGCKGVDELLEFGKAPPPEPGTPGAPYVPQRYPKALYKGTKENPVKVKVRDVGEEAVAIKDGAKTYEELFLGKKPVVPEKEPEDEQQTEPEVKEKAPPKRSAHRKG